MSCIKMFVHYVIILLSFSCCLEASTIIQVDGSIENQNDTTVLTLVRTVDNIKVVEDVGGGTVYLVYGNKKNYLEAAYTCRNRGTTLLRVDSIKKNEVTKLLIETFGPEGPFWIDAVWSSDDEWQWPNHKPIEHYYWNEGELNNEIDNKHCIELRYPGALWKKQICSEKIYFICELRVGKRLV